MDDISNLLCRILGVVGLVQKLSILSGPDGGDLVQVDSFSSELRQELSHEHNCCDVSCRDQVEFTSMSQLAKPEVVGLLIQQSRYWQFQRITSFDVQLLREGGLTDASWESQAVDLLIVVMVFVLLPMRIEIEAISPVVVHCCVTSSSGHMWSASMTRLR